MHHYTFENKECYTKIFVFRMLTARDVQFYGTITGELRFTKKKIRKCQLCNISGVFALLLPNILNS